MTGTSDRLAGTLGSLNPMRYRSYYFDTDTGYYYLETRYYSPEWRRFINADDPALLPSLQKESISSNLFVYCDNDPMNMTDDTGTAPGYITDQGNKKIRNIRWGVKGNTKDHGCGWVAVYNVMRKYSDVITYNYVINGLTRNGAVRAQGTLGAWFGGIKKFLKTRFKNTWPAGVSTKKWNDIGKKAGAVIILYKHRGGILKPLHYVAGIGKGRNKYIFYNCPHSKDFKLYTISGYISAVKKKVYFIGIFGVSTARYPKLWK